MRQLTDDHSLVGELVRRGQLTPAQAAVHPHRSVITRALGTDGASSRTYSRVSLEPGDRLVICSDGLSGMVPEQDIGRLLGEGEDPQSIAEWLVEAALEGGGEDNVTVVVLVVDEDDRGIPGEALGTLRTGLCVRKATRSRAGAPAGVHAAKAGAGGRLERVRGWVGRRRRGLLVVGGAGAGGVHRAGGRLALFNSTVYHVGTTEAAASHSTTVCPIPSSGGACTALWRWVASRTLRWSNTSRIASTRTSSSARRRGSSSSAASSCNLEHAQQGTPPALPRHPADHHRVRHWSTSGVPRPLTGSRFPTAPSSWGCSGWCMWLGVCWCRGRTHICCPSPPCSPLWGS